MQKVQNDSLDITKEWDEDGVHYTELIRQEYTGNCCVFSGGMVENGNPEEDTMYLRWEKDEIEPTMIIMRPDEIATINWICAGLLWSDRMNNKEAAHEDR